MATTVRAIKTGTIRIRPSHRVADMRKGVWQRRLAMLLDKDWTQPLPIYTYLIEHDEGILLLDSGETAPPSTSTSNLTTKSDHGYARWASTRQKTSKRLCYLIFTTTTPTG
jgi:hypothetical protein